MKRIRIRNHVAVMAHRRKGGPMKDRRAERGGAKKPSWLKEHERDQSRDD